MEVEVVLEAAVGLEVGMDLEVAVDPEAAMGAFLSAIGMTSAMVLSICR